MKINTAVPNKDLAISTSNKFAVYSAKLGELPVDDSLPSIKDGSMVLLGGDLWKVTLLIPAMRQNLGYQTVDTLILSKPDGKDALTLLYWTDFDKELAIPLDSTGMSLSFDAWMRPSTSNIGDIGVFWPKFSSSPPPNQNDGGIFGDGVVDSECFPAKHTWTEASSKATQRRCLEHTTKGEWKFWSAWLEEQSTKTLVCYNYGNIASTGTSGAYSEVFTGKDRSTNAYSFLETKTNEKLKKGYRYVMKGKK